MEIKAHFENIREEIIKNILAAEKEILIAMAWFTNHEIFAIVVEKVKQIPIELIVLNDDINNKINGVDFQSFIDNGGKFYFGVQENPMHNKFCIIDGTILMTGSYNYTYLAESINNENIIVFKGASDIIESYKKEFNNLTSKLTPIECVEDYLKLNPYQKDVFAYKNYGIRDIYSHTQELKLNGFKEKANSIITEIENNSLLLTETNFQINDVIYRQWKQDYYTDKIQVYNNTLILHFRTVSSSIGCWIHGPNTKYSWTLINTKNRRIRRKATRITNITINNKKVVLSIDNEEILYFSKAEVYNENTELGYQLNDKNQPIKDNGELLPIKFIKTDAENYILTCEVHFNIEGFPFDTVDLVEGQGTEKKENHWHCFDINLKLNRETL